MALQIGWMDEEFFAFVASEKWDSGMHQKVSDIENFRIESHAACGAFMTCIERGCRMQTLLDVDLCMPDECQLLQECFVTNGTLVLLFRIVCHRVFSQRFHVPERQYAFVTLVRG